MKISAMGKAILRITDGSAAKRSGLSSTFRAEAVVATHRGGSRRRRR
jgi:hypothetical protein